MFGFGVYHKCPSCGTNIKRAVVKIAPHRRLETYPCRNCKSDFVKTRKSELIRVLDDGLLLL